MSNLDDEYWGRGNYEMSEGSVGNMDWVRFPKHGNEPGALTDLRKSLGEKMLAGLNTFDNNSWTNAQNIANQVQGIQTNLLGQIPNAITNNQNLVNEITDIARNGNIPTNISNALNSSVNQELQKGMGSMLNNLASRGVLNSSVTTAGINQLSQAAADSYNRNYLTAYQTVLSGLGQGLQGAQVNTASLLSALGTAGNTANQAYENIGSQLSIPNTFWKDWQNFYQSDDPYDTIAIQKAQKTRGCITGDTLVTLAEGKQIPVAELKDSDEIKHGTSMKVS